MQYKNLPGTDQPVSWICLGTMTFGNPVGEAEAIELIRYAHDIHGINFIDTANMYEGYDRYAGSAGGVAEKIIGKAISGRRKDFIVATKVGMKVGAEAVDEYTSPEAIRIQLRRSLKRMNTDYIDIYYLHRPDPGTEPNAIVRAIADELRAGTIRTWGISNFSASQLQTLLTAADDENIVPPALCQPPLSLLNTDALDELIPLCNRHHIGIVPYQVLQGGILTGKYRRNEAAPAGSRQAEKPEWMKPLTDEIYKVLDRCETEAAAAKCTMTQYALQWALTQPGVVSALIGVKSKAQIDEAVGAVN